VSGDIPMVTVGFGAVGVARKDIVDLKVHLGCSKEVSSFECLLQNWDKKYSQGGSSPILVGADGYIDIGRGTNIPQILTCRVEKIKYESTQEEHYLRVSGRCWGERLFRRVITKSYSNQKGEAIVKDLMDSYALLSHTRNSTELVEDTDTTFTLLEYENTPLWDILKYIAESSDKAGIIGYDFRVAPDGKFEFFPKNSKVSPVSLTDTVEEVTEYSKDILRIRNKIMVYGLADKSVPLDKDSWTESLTPTDGSWSAAAGTVSLDTSTKVRGSASIKIYNVNSYYAGALFTLNDRKEVNTNVYPTLSFYSVLEKAMNGNVDVGLYDSTGKDAWKHITIGPGEWRKTDLKVGLANELEWNYVQSGFDWSHVKKIVIDFWYSGVGSGSAWIDVLYFGGCRYAAVREDTGSQSAYGLRELTETDEELVSDNECDLRARALLDYFKAPAEYLTLMSTVLDYGSTPLLPGDKIHAPLPNENVDSDYRIETAEYHVDAKTQTLEVTLELGKIPPMLADYLYGLRATTVTVEKLARTKLGKRGIPSVAYGGGLGSHHVGHEAGSDTGDRWPTDQDGGWDKLTGWVAPAFIGPFNDLAAIVKFRTKNKAGTAVVGHHFEPSDNEQGILGSELSHWKEAHSLYAFLYGYLRVRVAGDANPKAQLDASMLQFGPGGASALDTWLKRMAPGAFEVKNDLVPTGDNAGKIGYGGVSPKRWNELHVVDAYVDQYHFTGNLLPDADNLYDLGESISPKRWRDLHLAGSIRALAGGVAVHLLPNVDNTYNLGTPGTKWGNLYVGGLGDLGWLSVAGFVVITSGRVLQNVAADAAMITGGQFPLGRMPRGTSGYVLEGEGSADPMYVDPNGRYNPASHAHSAGDVTSGTFVEGRIPHVFASNVAFNGGLSADSISCNTLSITTSVNCKNWVHADILFMNNFRITEAENVNLGHGLVFLNSRGKITMFLDKDGNVEIFGRLKEKSSRFRRLWLKMNRKSLKGVAS